MAYEGTPVNIPIRGIERYGADEVANDGACTEIIGMEYKDGSFVPYTPKTAHRLFMQGTKYIRVHHATGQDNYIAIVDIQGVNKVYWSSKAHIDFYENDREWEEFWERGEAVIDEWNYIETLDGVSEIELLGNIVVGSNMQSVIWKDGDYIFYGDSNYGDTGSGTYYDLPSVSFRVTSEADAEHKLNDEVRISSGDIAIATGRQYLTTVTYRGLIENKRVITVIDLVSINANDAIATIATRLTGILKEKGRLTGYVKAVFAYRLTSGDLILASNPILLSPPFAQHIDDLDELYIPSSVIYAINENNSNIITLKSDSLNEYDATYFSFESGANGAKLTCNGGTTTRTIIDEGYRQNTNNISPLYGYYHNLAQEDSNVDDEIEHSGWRVIARSNVLQYKIDKAIDEKYKNTISGICLFLSQEVSPFKEFSAENVIHRDCSEPGDLFYINSSYRTMSYYFKRKTNNEISDEILKKNYYYLVEEIPFSEVKSSSDWITISLDGKLGDNLVVRERLPLTAFNHRKIFEGCLKVYNGRVMLFNYKQRLFNGYNLDSLRHKSFYAEGAVGQIGVGVGMITSNNELSVSIYVKYKSSETSAVLLRTCHTHYTFLSPLIVYPDANANEIVIQTTNNNTLYEKTLKLKSDFSANFAYYISQYLLPIHLLDNDDIVQAFSEISSNASTVYCENYIRASETYAPNIYPEKYINRIGNGKIVGLALFAVGSSMDAFGRYPIMALCSDGNFSISPSASGTFDNIVPYPSRDICVNRNSICEIDGMVVFASAKGLVVTDGQSVSQCVEFINGECRHLPLSTQAQGDGQYIYKQCINNDKIVSLTDSISQEDFINYVTDNNTYVSYVGMKNKIIVYNKNYPFVYWIDVAKRIATKLPYRISLDTNDFPNEDYIHELTTYTFNYLSEANATDCMFLSRPIKIYSTLKSPMRVVVDGTFYGKESSESWAELVVLGSLDNKHWHTIGVKQKRLSLDGFTNIGTTVYRTSYKSFMVLFTGRLLPNSHIEAINISIDEKYNNKLKR